MFKNLKLVRVIPLIIIIFLIFSLMGRDSLADIARFILSLMTYSLGILLIIWAVTQGRKKKASKKDGGNKREKP